MASGFQKLKKVIDKARMEYYKPIQVAEVLYRDRMQLATIDPDNLETFRVESRSWRDEVTIRLYGKSSTSSARFQDDLWNENAVPPWALRELLESNREDASIERYVYDRIRRAWGDLSKVFKLANQVPSSAQVEAILEEAWSSSPNSTDRVVEVLGQCLLNAELRLMGAKMTVFVDVSESDSPVSKAVKSIGTQSLRFERLGRTNAADAGLDIWSNFGTVVSVKNRRLTKALLTEILDDTPIGDLLVLCRGSDNAAEALANAADRSVSIVTLDSQISRADSLFPSTELQNNFQKELQTSLFREFPQTETFSAFLEERGYLSSN